MRFGDPSTGASAREVLERLQEEIPACDRGVGGTVGHRTRTPATSPKTGYKKCVAACTKGHSCVSICRAATPHFGGGSANLHFGAFPRFLFLPPLGVKSPRPLRVGLLGPGERGGLQGTGRDEGSGVQSESTLGSCFFGVVFPVLGHS